MLLIDDTQTLVHLLRGQRGSGTHAEKLQAFYAPQAQRYDAFRERLLHGRGQLIDLLDAWPGDSVVELGGGTGSNLALFGERLERLASFELVDLCPALLDIARQRVAGIAAGQSQRDDDWMPHAARSEPTDLRPHDIANIRITEADATTWHPETPVDLVYFSYSLTMIPDWEKVLDNAVAMLKPGGKLGVADFHIPAHMGSVAAGLWQRWFGHDGVHLSRDHLPALQSRLETVTCIERTAAVPYLSTLIPAARVPYYLYVGRKS